MACVQPCMLHLAAIEFNLVLKLYVSVQLYLYCLPFFFVIYICRSTVPLGINQILDGSIAIVIYPFEFINSTSTAKQVFHVSYCFVCSL